VSIKRSVLIVTSTYAPAMMADTHRARLLAWEMPQAGWAVDILAPGPEFQHPSCVEGDSDAFFSPAARVHYVAPWCAPFFRLLTVRSIGWRALVPMAVQGLRLLRQQRFDVVYITTTQFSLFLLGPLWCWLAGTPYVLDLHDPVYKEGTERYRTSKHRLKRIFSRVLAKVIETRTMKLASGVVSVSPHYLEELRRRYPPLRDMWQTHGSDVVIPFGARPEDLAETTRAFAHDGEVARPVLRIVYVGAGGTIMVRALRAICRALMLVKQADDALAARMRIELHGTMHGWREGDERLLWQTACQCGVGNLVEESPARVSYRRSLELLHEASGVLVLGVDHAGYMPSKLFGYALSGKPLLAAVHAASPARACLESNPQLGRLLWFSDEEQMSAGDAARVMRAFLTDVADGKRFDRRAVLEPVLARAMAARHAEFFERCLHATEPSPKTATRAA